jgi:hypothetical protein
MAVGVLLSHLDRCDPRSGALEHRGQSFVGAAVVGDLERLHPREVEAGGDVRLGVGREQQVERAVLHVGDDGVVVRVAVRAPDGRARRRPQDVEPQLPDAQLLTGARGDRPAAAALERAGEPALDSGRPAGAAVEYEPRPVRRDDGERHALVVSLRMREDEQVEAPDARLVEPLEDRPAGRSRVDEH